MKNTASKPASSVRSSRMMLALAASSFILLALVGALGLSSCASTPEGLKREESLYLSVSNGLAGAHQISPYLPAPANTFLEGLLGVGGALLAVWASHLHRSIRNLENGNPEPAPAPPARQAPPS